ncbi:uncharacterized protein LOC106162712 isoform X3 [Lingula anatina]|uniref:Uncharacterized protein LOC106162712 isoform X3 n=1 Tax=Lingula anatina TaxID=7574 RepID=A0A1S3IDM7_LINAN|nr:uncharacterized protein LOC106162712 isoform X3 [Lingula anatina]|eukprot:XP_013395544.1 uncharacterized protein LOC106162712 isoform X3 [Lingula anatina]
MAWTPLLQYIALGLIFCTQILLSKACRTDYTDVASRAFFAKYVFVGRVETLSPVGEDSLYNATFSVTEQLKGRIHNQKRIQSVTVGPFGPKNPLLCIGDVRQGEKYIVFLNSTLEVSGLAERASNRTIKEAKGILCKRCAKMPVIKKIRDVRAAEGDRVQIRCQVRGRPLPEITWYKDGEVIRNKKGLKVQNKRKTKVKFTQILRIRSFKGAYSGVYTCEAKSIVGTRTRSFNISAEPSSIRGNPSGSPSALLPGTTTPSQHIRNCPSVEAQKYCFNGGTCFILPIQPNEWHCMCPINWKGKRCETYHHTAGKPVYSQPSSAWATETSIVVACGTLVVLIAVAAVVVIILQRRHHRRKKSQFAAMYFKGGAAGQDDHGQDIWLTRMTNTNQPGALDPNNQESSPLIAHGCTNPLGDEPDGRKPPATVAEPQDSLERQQRGRLPAVSETPNSMRKYTVHQNMPIHPLVTATVHAKPPEHQELKSNSPSQNSKTESLQQRMHHSSGSEDDAESPDPTGRLHGNKTGTGLPLEIDDYIEQRGSPMIDSDMEVNPADSEVDLNMGSQDVHHPGRHHLRYGSHDQMESEIDANDESFEEGDHDFHEQLLNGYLNNLGSASSPSQIRVPKSPKTDETAKAYAYDSDDDDDDNEEEVEDPRVHYHYPNPKFTTFQPGPRTGEYSNQYSRPPEQKYHA